MIFFKAYILNFKSNSGQTLIETLAALFILIMGVTSSVGLAIFALNSSSSVTRQIIATGLAREGIEAIKNMRDTHWLTSTSYAVNNCYDYATGQANKANCYPDWLGTGGSTALCIDPTSNNGNCNGSGTTEDYALKVNPSFGTNANLFNVVRQRGAQNFGMTFDSTNLGGIGFYTQDGNTPCSGNAIADYCRKITITKLTPSSTVYDPATYGGAGQNPGPLVQVQSQVWWIDKKCPRAADFSSALPGCRVELDTYLTNWKNFQIP